VQTWPKIVLDAAEVLQRRQLLCVLAWQDISKRYRGSYLGPFWVTITLAVKITTLAMIYPGIMGAELDSYVPFISIGFIIWMFLSGIINDGCSTFVMAAPLMKQIKLPFLLYVAQSVLRNIFVLGHNMLVYVAVVLIFHIPLNLNTLYFIPAIVLLAINGIWINLVLAMLCARFRDIPEAVNSVLQIIFFTTPIFWQPKPELHHSLIFLLNPFYHAIEIGRAALLGQAPPLLSWAVIVLITLTGFVLATVLFGRYRNRITFWV
jgi:ABC-type polysaccharide/polyol phosphate export permease